MMSPCVYDVAGEWRLLQPLVENITSNSGLPCFFSRALWKKTFMKGALKDVLYPLSSKLGILSSGFRSHRP